MAEYVGEIAVRVRPLSPLDSLARAAEAIRTSPGGMVPVQVEGQIAGMVSASALSGWVLDRGDAAAEGATVAEVSQPSFVSIPHDATLSEALARLREEGRAGAPVVDPLGRYLGMVSQGELLSASMGALRPPLVGGMATPFGVYLTDGTRRGGVGDFALVSAGVFLGAIQVLSSWLGYRSSMTVMTLMGRMAPAWSRHLSGGFPPIMPPATLYVLASVLVFAALFRLSRVTGYHAAEHQVVHAIEQGDDLRADVVKGKPRVHPRCGTNLMAAFGIFVILDRWASSLAFVGAILFWRFFGSFLQQYITTRPADGRELESGITAGRQLLERYQGGIGRHGSGWLRLWNMGLLQVAFGYAIVCGILWLGHSLLQPGSPEATWFNNYLGS
jgi:CBS domain-containing protein